MTATNSGSDGGLAEGVGVEVYSNGTSGLTFDTPFRSLAMSQMLYLSSRKSLLLQEVLVVDKAHPMHGRAGYISSLERDTQNIVVLVTFPLPDGEKILSPDQLQLMGGS